MASANPRPTTSRKTPFTPPSAKPAGVKKQNTKTSAPKASPAGTKKGGNRTVAAKPSPANGNKRKTKAEVGNSQKVTKPRATRKKQKVDNIVDNSEVIDLSDEPATQSFFGDQQQFHLLPSFETPTHPPHEQLRATQQQIPYHMAHQQLPSNTLAQHRPMNVQQFQLPMLSQQRPMPSQQWSMPSQQRTMLLGQPTSIVIPQLPPNKVVPQQHPVSTQQHLSSILSHQPSTPPPQSPSDVFSQQLPFDMPPQQGPQPPQSPPVSITSQEHSDQCRQRSSGMLPQQRPIQPPQESSAMSPPQHLINLKQFPLNMSPQQHSVSKKDQQIQFALEPQQRTPVLDSQQPSLNMHFQQKHYVPIESYITNKLDADALNNADSANFDQLVLNMIKQNPTLSPEHNVDAVTSEQLDKCAYVLWEQCLWFNEGKLVLQAAMYGSMYQDVKIRALGMMNVLPGWWFLREKIKQWLKTSDKWVDDKEMEEQFNLSCARAKRIVESRRTNKGDKKEEEEGSEDT